MWSPWRRQSDEEFAEEIHSHIAHETKRLVEDEGMNIADARLRARRTFGNIAKAQERFFEGRPIAWLDDAMQDLRYSVRQIRRSPHLTSAVILTLAIGIGLNSVAFSIFNGLAYRPQVSKDPDSFVQTYSLVTGDVQREWHGTPSKATLETYHAFRQARTLSAVTARGAPSRSDRYRSR